MSPIYKKNNKIISYTEMLARQSGGIILPPPESKNLSTKEIYKESPRICIKILKGWRERRFQSWGKIAEVLRVERMTIYRWFQNKKINPCYMTLIHHINNDLRLGINPENFYLTSEEALNKLEIIKQKIGSWDKTAKALGMSRCKKTIMRWRKSGKISDAYLKRLDYFFKERKQ